MTKLKRILASVLVLTQLCIPSVFATETTDVQTSSYCVSIPETVDFGTLSHEEENSVTYQVSVSYTGDDTSAVKVTSDTTATLSCAEHSLTMYNDMDMVYLSTETPSAIGTLRIDSDQVVEAVDGDYKGTVNFSIALASTTLLLSETTLTMSQGAETSVTATLLNGEDYSLSAQSGDETVATAVVSDDVVTVTAPDAKRVSDATTTVTVYAQKEGMVPLVATIDITVYGTGSSGSTGGDTSTDSEYFLSNGYYYVDLWLWHQYADQVSMGDVAFQNNRQALVTVSGGKVTNVEVATGPVNVSGIESAVQYLEVEGEDIGYLERELFTTNTSELTFYYIKRAEFTMPDKGQPSSMGDETYLDVRLVVPDTPMDMVADEDGCMGARFRFDWSSVEATSDGNITQNNNMSSSTLDDEYLDDEEVVAEESAISAIVTSQATVNSQGKATVSFDDDDITDAIEVVLGAKAEAEDESETLVTLEVTYDDTATTLETTIPQSAFRALAEQVDFVKLDTPMGYLRLSADVLASVTEQSDGDVVITMDVNDVADMGITDQEVLEQIGDRTVMTFSMFGGSTLMTELGGTITVAIPYTLGDDESASHVVVYLVEEDGSVVEITNANYANGYVSFTTDQLGTYATGYDPNKINYTDVSIDSWYFEAIRYVTQLGLFQGVRQDAFAPEEDMTRGMVATVLYRLAGTPDVEEVQEFPDVDNDIWYSDAIHWVTQNEIMNEYSDGTFGVDHSVTREQLVTVLYRYGEMDGQDMEAEMQTIEGYQDENLVSDWAYPAMCWSLERGLIVGATEETLLPQGIATRAQVATIFMRFLQ